MSRTEIERPDCFGDLETVFPLGENELRQSPESCLTCPHKTDCLRRALGTEAGAAVERGGAAGANPSSRLFKGLRRWSHLKAARDRNRSGK